MVDESGFLQRVHEAARKKVLFSAHAVRQMAKAERMITTSDVQLVITEGEMIEDYQEDERGHSCLMLGYREGGRPVHIVCSPKEDYLAIITAYVPDRELWTSGFKERKS